MNLVYLIGNYGQSILFIITVYLLWGRYAIYYTCGILINAILNLLLKGVFREARPSESNEFKMALKKGEKVKRFVFKNGMPRDKFGMPSGHSESTMFSSVFIYDFNKKIFPLFLVITFITMFQRVYYNYHTVSQVIVGAIVGILFGIIFKNILNKIVKV